MEFLVDIKKRLNDFFLNVTLSSTEEVIGILGASGSGKSMLLRCIAGLVKPDEGKIIINGKTYFDSEKKINLSIRERKVGFLFQNYALFPTMTVAENIAFGLDKLSKSQKQEQVDKLLNKYHLGDIGKRYPTQISGGQQQRVALARAVAVDPDILLLDEPFSALDVHLRNHMIKEMSETLSEFKGLTLFVTHNREEAYGLCDWIAIFNAGKMEVIGEKNQVFKRPSSVEAAKITGCKNIVAARRLSKNQLDIPEWGVTLRTEMEISPETGFMGIRANQVKLMENAPGMGENVYPVWIADEREGPFRIFLYLKIGTKPQRLDDFHLQCEISREERQHFLKYSQPFSIYLHPDYLFFVEK